LKGNSYQISQEMLKSIKKYRKYTNIISYNHNTTLINDYEYDILNSDRDLFENFLYKIIQLPKFGKLKFRIRKISHEINKFTQRDINEGIF
jgi:hypothetical protein